eukprot:scaffold995_cov358-Pavlova_lutheri.AAC.10
MENGIHATVMSSLFACNDGQSWLSFACFGACPSRYVFPQQRLVETHGLVKNIVVSCTVPSRKVEMILATI